ncbi:MAG TPA: hypothetical protein PLH83_07610 [Ruminococcus sp.]|nr:hypothetical protein [Ruminococcus sp.]
MIEQDTVKLLRECDSGIEMGISAINEVIGRVSDDRLRKRLSQSLDENTGLKTDLQELLDIYHDSGKEPPAMVKGMSKLKTGFELAMDGSDGKIAELMIDGCNMGVKSLSRYLNQYKAADERSKDLAKRLISAEVNLSCDMRGFL